MHFLYPSFLYALGLAAIPVIIHLFNFRRYKKIVFSDIRFLKQITEQNKKQQTVKQWLILLCRILAIVFLVLAFAQPFIPSRESAVLNNQFSISVYLDNSFSMQSNSKDGSLLEQGKKKAKQIADAYRESDQFQLLTNDFEGKHQRLVKKKDFLEMLEEVQISPAHRNLTEVYNRQNSLSKQMNVSGGQYYWISDFQKNMDPQNWSEDSSRNIFLVPLQSSQQQNVWIDSAWFPDPFLKKGVQNKLLLRVRNESDNDFENQPVVLKIDGVQKAIQNVSCPSKKEVEVNINFTLSDFNWHGVSVSLTDYPLVFDDTYFLAAKAKEFAKVLIINDDNKSEEISRVFGLDSFYQTKEVSIHQLNFADFASQSAIVLNEPAALSSGLSSELIRYLKGGGIVMLIPNSEPQDLLSIRYFLSQAGITLGANQKQQVKVSQIETKDPVFARVFTKVPELANLPASSEFWELSGSNSDFRTILKLNNDFPFLARSKNQLGACFVLAGSLRKEVSNFAHHALFVPFMLNMPLQTSLKTAGSFNLSEQGVFTFEAKNIQKVLTLKLGKQEHLVEVRITEGEGFGKLSGQLKEAGIYSLMDGSEEWTKIAFNFPRTESVQGYLESGELSDKVHAAEMKEDLSALKTTMEKEMKGNHFWQLALLLALLFFSLEISLLRWSR